MKKLLLCAAVACSCISAGAQQWAYETIDINQVKTRAISNGDLFWNYSSSQFEVPKDSTAHTIFAGAAWIGGLDTSGALYMSGQVYRQLGNDFYPGPVMDSLSYSAATDGQWNQVWKINKSTIDSFVYACNNSIPGFTVPQSILTWPGNGDVQAGQAAQLAPFVDADGDGIYNPAACDYPCIKGDQALFFIFNDDRALHGETGGAKMKVEVHGMLYAYSAPGSWLDSTVFLNYKIYNRSSKTYEEVYWAQWTDFDIGDPFDDYVGCDVTRNISYGYNGDYNDGPTASPGFGTYGANPPAQGVVFLRGPEADAGDGIDNNRNMVIDEPGEICMMNHFMYYENDFSVRGNAEYDNDYYGYMKAEWKDSSHATYGGNAYGGSTNCDFMFPGDTDPLGWGTGFVPQLPWDETTSNHLPSDRRALASTGPFTFNAAESNCLDFAYVFGRGSNGPPSSVAAMQNAADSAHIFYAQNNPCDCNVSIAGVASHQSASLGIYPNPASNNINIMCGDNSAGAKIEIIDATGKLIKTSTVLSGNSAVVDVTELPSGIYLVRVNKGSVVLTGKFVRN